MWTNTTPRGMLGRCRLTVVHVVGGRAAEIAARVAGASAKDGGAPSGDHPHSDVDVGVQSTRGTRLAAEQRVRLTIELEGLFAVARVDLVVLSEANPRSPP